MRFGFWTPLEGMYPGIGSFLIYVYSIYLFISYIKLRNDNQWKYKDEMPTQESGVRRERFCDLQEAIRRTSQHTKASCQSPNPLDFGELGCMDFVTYRKHYLPRIPLRKLNLQPWGENVTHHKGSKSMVKSVWALFSGHLYTNILKLTRAVHPMQQ